MPALEEFAIFRTIAQFVKTHKYCWLVLFFVVYIIAFFIIEAHTPTEGYWVTDLPIDNWIPFIPQFIFCYVFWYPLFVAVGVPMLIKDGAAFKRWMYYMMAVLSITLIFDVLVPNGQGLRPENVEVTGLATWLLNRIWAADTPTNVFPSMHVLGCIGDVIAVFDSKLFKNPWKWIIIVAAVLCAASTVLVKQHAFLDTVGAFALAVPVFFAVYGKRFFGKKHLQDPAAA